MEKTLMLGKIKGGRKGGDRGWDGWMASLTRWTRVWISSGCWWWTGKPGMLQSMGLQRCWLSKTWLSNWTELTEVLQDKTNSINMKPGLQFGHRLMMISVYIHPGIISRNPELQFLKCRPWSGRTAWDLFPVEDTSPQPDSGLSAAGNQITPLSGFEPSHCTEDTLSPWFTGKVTFLSGSILN